MSGLGDRFRRASAASGIVAVAQQNTDGARLESPGARRSSGVSDVGALGDPPRDESEIPPARRTADDAPDLGEGGAAAGVHKATAATLGDVFRSISDAVSLSASDELKSEASSPSRRGLSRAAASEVSSARGAVSARVDARQQHRASKAHFGVASHMESRSLSSDASRSPVVSEDAASRPRRGSGLGVQGDERPMRSSSLAPRGSPPSSKAPSARAAPAAEEALPIGDEVETVTERQAAIFHPPEELLTGSGAVGFREQNKRERAASKLMDVLLPGSMRVEQVSASRFQRSPVDMFELKVAYLSAIEVGGKNGEKCDKARLFIRDWQAELSRLQEEGAVMAADDDGGVWPIKRLDAQSFAKDASTPATAAGRVGDALALLDEILVPGFVVDSGVIIRRPAVRRAPKGNKAREPHGPKYLHDLEVAAKQTAEATSGGEPMLRYVRGQFTQFKLGVRQASAYNSNFVVDPSVYRMERVPGAAIHLRTQDGSSDKGLREHVDIYADEGGFVDDAVPWLAEHGRVCSADGFMFPDWTNNGNVPTPARYDLVHNKGFRTVSDARVLAQPERAREGSNSVTRLVSGLSAAELSARKLSGTHPPRKVGGEVTLRLRWPDTEADVVGDWASTPSVSDFPVLIKKPREAAAAATAGGSTRKKFYVPNSGPEEQVHIRRRYAAAIREGLRLFGVERLTSETSWADIFPWPAPPSLASFYGPFIVADYQPFPIEVAAEGVPALRLAHEVAPPLGHGKRPMPVASPSEASGSRDVRPKRGSAEPPRVLLKSSAVPPQ